jgi:signal transduction histidine kinase
VVHIGTFVVAVVASATADGVTGSIALATAIAGAGVLLAYTVPIPIEPGQKLPIVTLLVSASLFVAAIALTGGVNSAFVVMPLASIFLAAFAGGARLAGAVTLVSVTGVAFTWITADAATGADTLLRVIVIYGITAVAFSEVHRALASEAERVDDLLLATRTSAERRERLEATHMLLEDLLRIANSPDVNAVAAAQDAVRDIAIVAPEAAMRIVSDGDIHLARRGDVGTGEPSLIVPITRPAGVLARLELWMTEPALTPRQRAAIEASVEPVGLALENDAMVQELAGMAIQRERVRLARELHDEIAPSIASVGLALDMMLLADDLGDDQVETLEVTRSNVTHLVERVRNRVQDLRADRSLSLVEVVHRLVAEVDVDGPAVVVDIDERTPPRPAIAMEVSALVTESFRNAVTHARASLIRISGRIDEAKGNITVEDNGIGFEASADHSGRYGLVGMQERAGLIGADLEVASDPGAGTTVTIAWRETR